jgi:hypothetical protein
MFDLGSGAPSSLPGEGGGAAGSAAELVGMSSKMFAITE